MKTLLFDNFRLALSRLPAGLLRPGRPCAPAQLRAAEAQLGRTLPPSYAAFLLEFGGADLFHEAFVVAGVGPGVALDLEGLNAERRDRSDATIALAASGSGDLFFFGETPGVNGEPLIFKWPEGSDGQERWLSGSTFERWLDALVAREQILYDGDGEFLLEVFEEDGEDLTPVVALRRAERALKKDAASAEHHHDLGLALRRLGRLPGAEEAFARAAALDAANPWAWFDLGRARLSLGAAPAAVEAFRTAAQAAAGGEAARLWAWTARAAVSAGDRPAVEAARAAALADDPALLEGLRRAAEAAAADGEEEAEAEAAELVSAFDEAVPVRRRLPVLARSSDTPVSRGGPAAGPERRVQPALRGDVAASVQTRADRRARPAAPSPGPGEPRGREAAAPPPRGSPPRDPSSARRGGTSEGGTAAGSKPPAPGRTGSRPHGGPVRKNRP